MNRLSPCVCVIETGWNRVRPQSVRTGVTEILCFFLGGFIDVLRML